MKRFFDLSLLILIPIFLAGNFNVTPDNSDPIISERAKEIHAIISSEIEMSLEDIQEALDNIEMVGESADAKCTLSCNPPNCCYTQGHLDRLIFEFGCCIDQGNCPYPCLDLNGSGCVTTADLTFLLGNWCVD